MFLQSRNTWQRAQPINDRRDRKESQKVCELQYKKPTSSNQLSIIKDMKRRNSLVEACDQGELKVEVTDIVVHSFPNRVLNFHAAGLLAYGTTMRDL